MQRSLDLAMVRKKINREGLHTSPNTAYAVRRWRSLNFNGCATSSPISSTCEPFGQIVQVLDIAYAETLAEIGTTNWYIGRAVFSHLVMTRPELLGYLATKILAIQKDSPVLVGIDGVDASGKTTLANELLPILEKSDREIIRASIDGFHNPQSIRYGKGKDSPGGYYEDSFNYNALAEVLLEPLHSGSLVYRPAVFDYRTDSDVVLPVQQAASNAILVMEGIFLFRPELVDLWDLKIFVDVGFNVTVPRAIKRATERERVGNEQEIIDKYNQRYIPGQKIYFERAHPKKKADIVVDNTDFENPTITKG